MPAVAPIAPEELACAKARDRRLFQTVLATAPDGLLPRNVRAGGPEPAQMQKIMGICAFGTSHRHDLTHFTSEDLS